METSTSTSTPLIVTYDSPIGVLLDTKQDNKNVCVYR